METFNIRAALGTGWHTFMLRPWYLLGTTLLLVVLMVFTVSDALTTALSAIAYAGFWVLIIRHYRGEGFVLDDMFITDQRWIYLAFVIIIKSLIILLGFVFFILPGIYFAIRLMFAELYVIEEGKRPFEALKASVEVTQGYWWKLFWFSIVVLLLSIIGIAFFVIGILIVGIIASIATIKIFDELRGIQWRKAHPEG